LSYFLKQSIPFFIKYLQLLISGPSILLSVGWLIDFLLSFLTLLPLQIDIEGMRWKDLFISHFMKLGQVTALLFFLNIQCNLSILLFMNTIKKYGYKMQMICLFYQFLTFNFHYFSLFSLKFLHFYYSFIHYSHNS
jgi:hypothetical protein